MAFISYAQNFEDVIIHRVLSEIKNGFYIDVGAANPVIDSVTRAFYDSGWNGINIEPNPQSYLELTRYRQREVNVRVALGREIGKIDFWQMEHDGLSTASESQFLKHEVNGFEGQRIEVECQTLSAICKEFAQVPDIHFLKIDVEGWERDVLLGANLVDFRPWIVLIEATIPNTQTDVSSEWLELLIESNYEIGYRDGLNIYFLAKEKIHLKEKFQFPPNVFDDFIKFDHSLNIELSNTRQELSNTRQDLSNTRQELSNNKEELHAILESNIWVKTRYLRDFKRYISRVNKQPKQK